MKNLASCLLAFGLAWASVESVLAVDRIAIVSEGGTARNWRTSPGVVPAVPAYPGIIADKSDDVCVSVGYLLKRDGTTSDFSLLKSWTGKDQGESSRARIDPFAQNAVAAVQQWRFVPAEGRRARLKPVYTSATFIFTTNPAADTERLRGHCAIGDLPAFVANAQAEAYRKGNLNKAQMERNRVQYPATINSR